MYRCTILGSPRRMTLKINVLSWVTLRGCRDLGVATVLLEMSVGALAGILLV